MIDIGTATGIIAAIATTGGMIYTSYRHVTLGMAIKREKYRESILDQAKEEVAKVSVLLEDKIKKLEVELETQKQIVTNEFTHVKDTYNAEVRVLGQRIQELREDLAASTKSMLELLVKLVDSK